MNKAIISILFITHISLSSAQHSIKEKPEVWITIFIHGILSVKPYLNLGNMSRFIKDSIANSWYERSIELIRKEPYFHQHHPMQALGLHKIDINLIAPGASASGFARIYDELTKINAPKQTQNYYYTFGWSGLLSAKMRYLEAEIFYQQLGALVETYKEQEIIPHIRIIGYSHGGNVILNLAMIAQKKPEYPSLSIDELILIGMPVIPETDYLINHPMFKKIYHFYSLGDRVQRIDLFSSYRLLSQRRFIARESMEIPKKLTQIELRLTRLVRPKFRCSTKKTSLQHWKIRKGPVRNADPGHSELWSFGWTPGSYRTYLPIYPLPMAVFLGFIINALPTESLDPLIVLDIHPFNQVMFLLNNNKTQQLPFLTEKQLRYYKNEAYLFKPHNYFSSVFNQRMSSIIKQAEHQVLAQQAH